MDVQQFLQSIWARKWVVILTLLVTVTTAGVLTKIIPYSYTATTQLVVDFRDPSALSTVDLPMQMSTSYMSTQMDILKSERVGQRVVELLKLDQVASVREDFMNEMEGKGSLKSWLANKLIKEVDIEPSRDSRLITLSFTGHDPRFATIIANTFARAFIEINLDLHTQPARDGSVWFDEQVKRLRGRVEAAQAKLTQYQQTKGIIVTDERLDSETNRLNDLSANLVRTQAESADLEAREKQMKEIASSDASMGSLPEAMTSPLIQQIKNQIGDMQGKLSELSQQYGVNHPQYHRTEAELFSLKGKLKEELNNLAQGITHNADLARERRNMQEKAYKDQKASLLDMKRQRDELAVLNRDVEYAQRIYDAAQDRFNAMTLESQVSQTNIAVLTEALEPAEPSRPKVLQNMVLAVFLGIFLGVGVALLMEVVDRRVRSVADLTDALKIPALGFIPDSRKFGKHAVA